MGGREASQRRFFLVAFFFDADFLAGLAFFLVAFLAAFLAIGLDFFLEATFFFFFAATFTLRAGRRASPDGARRAQPQQRVALAEPWALGSVQPQA